jgi:hypothetical protein
LVSGAGRFASLPGQCQFDVGTPAVLKNLFAAARIYAFLNLLFVPAIGAFVLLAWLYGDPDVAGFWGISAFVANGTIVITEPRRSWIWAHAIGIGGFAAKAHTTDQPSKG